MLLFLYNGMWASIADRIAGTRVVATRAIPRRATDNHLSRELLWQGVGLVRVLRYPWCLCSAPGSSVLHIPRDTIARAGMRRRCGGRRLPAPSPPSPRRTTHVDASTCRVLAPVHIHTQPERPVFTTRYVRRGQHECCIATPTICPSVHALCHRQEGVCTPASSVAPRLRPCRVASRIVGMCSATTVCVRHGRQAERRARRAMRG